MNKARRERLKVAVQYLNSVYTKIDAVCNEEEDCVDNYPENLQGTERYENMEVIVENLNEALDKIDEVKELVQSALT